MITKIAEMKEAVEIKALAARLNVECPPDGLMTARLAVVAEAPGEREISQRLPLVGGSGALLWRMLAKHTGLTRKDVYISNVSKRQIALSNDTRKAMNRHELDLWASILNWELSNLPNLEYILVLGNMSLQAITGQQGITNWRGSVLTIDQSISPDTKRSVQVICTNNPAAIIREPKLEVSFNLDMAKLKRVIDGKHKDIPVETALYPSPLEIRGLCERIREQDHDCAYDIEVIANETACIGVATDTKNATCIAFRDRVSNFYSEADERQIRRDLSGLFSDQRVRLVAQNNMFDSTWLWYKDKMRVQPIWFDTMLAHHTLYPTLPHNLGFLTTQYTDHPYYKGEKDSWKDGGDIDDFWRYNGKDCAHTLAVAYRELGELRAQQLDGFFFSHVMRLQHHLARMTVGGILVDIGMKEKLSVELRDTVNNLHQQLQVQVRDSIGDPDYTINPNSPRQLSDLLFNKLKLVGRGSSTDAENRKRMFNHPRTSESSRQILQTLNDYAKESKFFSTYAESRPDEDARMRCEYKQTGVQSAPGRLSSAGVLWKAKGNDKSSGMNLQNQPDRAQPMFLADPGYGFAYFDLAQAEARYVGWDAEIETWIEQFERARIDGVYDAHRALAADMFDTPYDEVPTFDRYDSSKHVIPEGFKHGDVTIRFTAKRCRHGLNYRMAPDRLATTTGLPLRTAELAYNKYHRITPELRRWWANLEKEIRDHGALYNSFGRRFKIMERLTEDSMESIVAFKPQSTIGDLVCKVIYEAEDDPRWPSDARMVLNIHDALIALAPLDKLKTCLSIMKAYAERPILVKGRELIIPADCKTSYADEQGKHRWSQLKAVDIEKVKIT